MGLLSGIFLFGLPLAGLPVIVHLLHRRRQEVVAWGAMRFLVDVTSFRKRFQRLEDLLLMLLRALLVAAFIFALARPELTGSWAGQTGPRDVVLLLDVSLSTSQSGADGMLFDAQRRQADLLIDSLTERDMVRVMLASAGPHWLSTVPTQINAATRAELHKRLAQLQPTLGAVDMLRCLREALAAPSADDDARRVIVVLTDGQAFGWRAAAGSAWREIGEEIEDAPVPPIVKVVDLGRGERTVANVAVEAVTTSRTVAAAGDLLTVTARVVNTGDEPIGATLVGWSVADAPIGATTMSALEPGQTTTVQIQHRVDRVGVFDIACRIDLSDELPLDNVGACVVEVVDDVPILIVTSDSTRDPAGSGTNFLLAALGCDRQGRRLERATVFRPNLIRAEALGDQRLGDYHCVVLADPGELPATAVHALENYVRNGGGLWITLGERTDHEAFNEMLHARGGGLAPLPLAGPALGDAADHETFIEIHPPLTKHRATTLLADTKRLDIDFGHVYRRHRFVREKGNGKVSVLLTAGQGELLAVERTWGKGRVIVQAVPLGPEWSNLPLLQAYVVMAHEWLWYLVEPAARRWNLHVGEPLRVSFTLAPFDPAEADLPALAAIVSSPLGDEAEVVPTLDAGRLVYTYGQTLFPGRYGLQRSSPDAAGPVLPFYVGRDPDESDLTPLAEQDATFLATSGKLAFAAEATPVTSADDTPGKPKPIWTALLFALLALMLVELFLATWTNRRRLRQPPGVVMETP